MKNVDTNSRDKQLAAQIRIGDKAAFRNLYDRYYPILLNFSFNKVGDINLAEDFTQDIFTWIWDRREIWEPNQSVKSYLYRALSNRMITHFRKKKYEIPTDFNECPEKIHPVMDEEEDEYKKEVHVLVRKYIKLLPKRRRAILYLFIYKGLSYKQISSSQNISVNTVDMQLRRARNGVKKNKKIAKYYSAMNTNSVDTS